MRLIWLASYPKSGNTWMRMLIAAAALKDSEALDINDLRERRSIASSRKPFDDLTLIDSGLLMHDEIDALRPAVYEAQRRDDEADEDTTQTGGVLFERAHDAYTYLPDGTPLLAGANGADGAVLIVRDPRGIAPSLANHNGIDLDGAVAQLNNPDAAYASNRRSQAQQLRHRLLDWSGHACSWLNQNDLPVHLVRYEDMIADTASTLAKVLNFAGRPAGDERVERAVALCEFSTLRAQEEGKGFGEASTKSAIGRFFRRGEAFAWRTELTLEQTARIEHAHGAMMKALGYPLSGDKLPVPARPQQTVALPQATLR